MSTEPSKMKRQPTCDDAHQKRLFQAISNSDTRAFGEIFSLHREKVLAIAFRTPGRKMLQKIFLKAAS